MNNIKIINKNNLIHNINFIKKSKKNICAMVKADAYGHGINTITNIIKNEVNFFGVANIDEAIKVKKVAPLSNILVVGKSNCFLKLIRNNISFTIDSLNELQNVLKVCKSVNKQAKIHIAINTGMNRIGLQNINEFKEILDIFNKNFNLLKLEGVFTHCFDADCKESHFYEQMQEFYKYVKLVKFKDVIVHIGGSFVLNYKLPSFVNMVRVGFFIYGYGHKSLKPVVQIKSKIIKIIDCKKGSFVGYGNKNILTKDCKVAVLPIGYSDGINWRLSNKSSFLINGQKAKIIAKVCMDMSMVDVSNIKCKEGDWAVAFSNANEMADILKTSAYEILTNFQSLRGKSLIV